MKMHRVILAVAAVAYSAASVAIGSAPKGPATPQTLSVGFVKVGHLSPLMLVADAMKTCNTEIKPVEFVRYADARTAMMSGSLDIAGVGPGDLIITLAQGSDKLVGMTGVASSPKWLVTRKGVKMDDWADLKGKRVGIAPGSAVWFQWAATLVEKGVPYTSFTAVNVQGGGTAFVQALQRGDVDAVALWEPFESQLVADGTAYFAKNLEYSQSKAVGAELGVLAATRDALQNKRDAVRCFLWAYKGAEEKLAKDPELFAEVYSKYTGLPLSVTRESVKLIKLGGVLDVEQLRRQAKAFNELGVIPKDVSNQVDKVWDDSLVKDVQ